MQTNQPAEDKGLVQRDSPIHRVEVVNAVLNKGQQKEQVVLSTGLNKPISILGRIPILRPQQTEEPNLILCANLSGPSRSIPTDQLPIPV